MVSLLEWIVGILLFLMVIKAVILFFQGVMLPMLCVALVVVVAYLTIKFCQKYL